MAEEYLALWERDKLQREATQAAQEPLQPSRPKPRWSDQVAKGHPSAPTPSPTMCWWNQEFRKRAEGLENEIDINEIKAAYKGIKNKWTKVVVQYPQKFIKVIDEEKYNWTELLELRAIAQVL